MSVLEPGEERVMKKLREAWDEFNSLEQYHPDDIHEFRAAIHQAQNIVLARMAVVYYAAENKVYERKRDSKDF